MATQAPVLALEEVSSVRGGTILGFCDAVSHPSSGTVEVFGARLGRVELQALRRRTGHVDPRHPLRPR